MNKTILAVVVSLAAFSAHSAFAAEGFTPNYDESKTGSLSLPQLIPAGTKDARVEWETTRRSEILNLFHDNVYGKAFTFKTVKVIKTSAKHPLTLSKGYWQTVDLSLDGRPAQLLMYMPESTKPAPVFVGYNFCGNHGVTFNPELPVSTQWANPLVCGSKVDPTLVTTLHNTFTPASRGVRAYRWPFDDIVSQGFGVATLYYGDVVPDNPADFQRFIQTSRPGEAVGDYSAIGVWAGGLSAVADYLQTRNDVDSNRLAVVGHSRLGKTALWAGANDVRFRYVIANDAGEGGAALARRNYGETLASITTDFPHWFSAKYASYANNINALPVDQHMLISLIAPRPVYVASAKEDQWSDPKGEFLSVVAAKSVYRLYTDDIFTTDQQPKTGQPLHSRLNYHYREGVHDIYHYDWQQYLEVGKKYLQGETSVSKG
ncbi:hypothetical protein CJP72_04415 [Citrobacter sp. NCU1]|uniref:glucuronyl esterase domain-containing protein n=1 Tax=Citrobacter sp. NCU1 TaxID=2026683 RepID=UPI00139165E3|nr:acetylxylan esterase [Citrobacter sp. NCU1]NDO80047.1 hypothetical protein [Citrobacter sp. NCU1]